MVHLVRIRRLDQIARLDKSMIGKLKLKRECFQQTSQRTRYLSHRCLKSISPPRGTSVSIPGACHQPRASWAFFCPTREPMEQTAALCHRGQGWIWVCQLSRHLISVLVGGRCSCDLDKNSEDPLYTRINRVGGLAIRLFCGK